MPKTIVSEYTKYEFTPEEMAPSHCFTDLQEAHIKNELAIAAEDKLGIAYNPVSANADREFQNSHEYQRGRCDSLRLLLAMHENYKDEMQQLLVAQAAKQQESEGE